MSLQSNNEAILFSARRIVAAALPVIGKPIPDYEDVVAIDICSLGADQIYLDGGRQLAAINEYTLFDIEGFQYQWSCALDNDKRDTFLSILDAIYDEAECSEGRTQFLKKEAFLEGESYIFSKITERAEEFDFQIIELGEEVIGRHVIQVTSEEKCYTFLLSGSNSFGYVYTCLSST
jgi:hypothetical protein